MLPIIVCCDRETHLRVLEASVRAYYPGGEIIWGPFINSNFGDSYNAVMDESFKKYDEVIIANDDAVLTPSTMTEFIEDINFLKTRHGDKLGMVATHFNEGRASQNIKYNERLLRTLDRVSPVFAYISKTAYEAAPFPPINWYGDDVVCEDLLAAGFTNYVSRAYVHHVGSATIGHDHVALNRDAMPWLIENRPQYIHKWF